MNRAKHNDKLPATGPNSWKGMLNPDVLAVRFRGFPKDHHGKTIPLSEFESMTRHHLAIWRTHIILSYTAGSNYEPKFTVLEKGGKVPVLTDLRMKSPEEEEKPRQAVKVIKKGKSKGAKQDEAEADQKKKKHSRETIIDSDDDSSPSPTPPAKKRKQSGKDRVAYDGESYSDSDGKHGNTPPARKPAPRNASTKASIELSRQVAQEAKAEQSELAKRKVVEFRPKPGGPGSDEGRLRARKRLQEESVLPPCQYLQLRSMQGNTLPKEWTKLGFRAFEVCSLLLMNHSPAAMIDVFIHHIIAAYSSRANINLQVRDAFSLYHAAARRFSLPFKASHKALPPLFPLVVGRAADTAPIPHPSLFELQASIEIHALALKEASRTCALDLDIPAPPVGDDDKFSAALLEGIFDPEVQIPFYYQNEERSVQLVNLHRIGQEVVKWLEEALGVLETQQTFQLGAFPANYLLKMVRGLAFVRGLSLDELHGDDTVGHKLYCRLYDCFASLSLFRYSSLVLGPLVTSIPAAFGSFKRSEKVQVFLAKAGLAVQAWIAFAARRFPSLLQVCHVLNYHAFLCKQLL